MVTEKDLTLGGEHTMQYTDDVSWNCTTEHYIISLTNVNPMKLVLKRKKMLISTKKFLQNHA